MQEHAIVHGYDPSDSRRLKATQLGKEPINAVVFPLTGGQGGLRLETEYGWIKANDQSVIFDVSNYR